MYQRRNKFDPLWNALVVGGYQDGKRLILFIMIIYKNNYNKINITKYYIQYK